MQIQSTHRYNTLQNNITLIIFTKELKNKNALIPTEWNISIFYLLSKYITLITSTVVDKKPWEMLLC